MGRLRAEATKDSRNMMKGKIMEQKGEEIKIFDRPLSSMRKKEVNLLHVANNLCKTRSAKGRCRFMEIFSKVCR